MPENYTARRLAAPVIILLIIAASFGYLWLQRDNRHTTAYGIADKVKKDSIPAPKEHELMFDNISLRQLIGTIDKQYGIHVRLDDEATGNTKISGILPNDNLDVLLKALEAMDLRIDRQGENITIRKRS
jgi:ferric-dicitrate binding protein FerR (iron transport regulator)